MLRRLSYKAVKNLSGHGSSGRAVQWRVSGVQGFYVPEQCSSGNVRSPSAVRNGARALWQFGNDETGTFQLLGSTSITGQDPRGSYFQSVTWCDGRTALLGVPRVMIIDRLSMVWL